MDQKKTNRLFLLALMFPMIAVVIGSIVNPHGWMSWGIAHPYLLAPAAVIGLLEPLGDEVALMVVVGVIGALVALIVFANKRLTQAKSRLLFLVVVFSISTAYSVWYGMLVAQASEHEFTG